MSLRRNLLRWLSVWLITAIVFSQIAVAAHACPLTPVDGGPGPVAMAGMPCAETMSPAMTLDADQPGLCLQHCQFGSTGGQPADHAVPIAVAVVAWLLLFTLIPTAARLISSSVWLARQHRRDRAPPPPHSILHCCHRI